MNHLLTGTVTFLFSDIEGSTRLLQAAGSGYQDLLATHAGLIRAAAERHGGVEISTEGDSFFLVFASPVAAVTAAAEAQRDLVAHPWPDGLEVRVRMGLHTGEAELGGDNYAGIDVNRTARVASAGHGGQVLLSETTRALVARKLPAGVALRDLGPFRLKDLPEPEHLHQLLIDTCPMDFPPPRSLDVRPNNLPTPLTRFIGRDDVLAEILAALSQARLLTLSGPGGTGKTRLALESGRAALPDFEDGVFWVDLSAIRDPKLVPAEVAEALGVAEHPSRSRVEVLTDHLAGRELLLVLDNFEQVTDAAPVVGELLAAAPKLKVLATSRIVLHVAGEREYPVPPLQLPDPDVLPDAALASQYEAVMLFVDRATAVKPDFQVTNDNAPAVAEITYRLDGLPLAIELAASRVKLLSPEAMLQRLGKRLELVTGGARDLPERQQTLRGAIAWSHDLLEEPERALFARLAAFNGGATLEAAEAVCNPGGELGIDTFEGLALLVDNSLLRQRAMADGEPRFLMLETIREYAGERLRDSGEEEATRRRHAEWFVAMAEEAEPELTRDRAWLDRCAREHDNLRAALRWSIDAGEAGFAFRIGGSLWRYFHQRGHLSEGRRWLEEALALPVAGSGTGVDRGERAKALTGVGGLVYWQNDYETAGGHYAAAAEIYRELGDPLALANGLFDLAYIHFALHDWAAMEAALTEALAAARRAEDDHAVSKISLLLGFGALVSRDFERAIPALEDGVATLRRVGDRFQLADGLSAIGQGYTAVGRFAEAHRALVESTDMFVEDSNPTGLGQTLYAFALLAAAQEDWERALRLTGASAAVREHVGGGAPPEIMDLVLGNPEAIAREQADPADADRWFAEGFALSQDAALAYAMDESP